MRGERERFAQTYTKNVPSVISIHFDNTSCVANCEMQPVLLVVVVKSEAAHSLLVLVLCVTLPPQADQILHLQSKFTTLK